MRDFLSILLRPLAFLYQLVTDFRNQLYDKQLKPSFSFEKIAVVNVGNLRVGGTGKTPMVEYLLGLLSEYCLGTISRGYKRKTKGIILANEESTPEELGDEPYQFHRKFKDKGVQICVGEERPLAVVTMIHEKPDIEVMVLDDAYQHRPVRPDLNILLTEYKRPFYQDFVLPAGRLRESRKGAKRADIIVVTKAPMTLGDEEMAQVKAKIFDYNAEASVFFSGIRYGAPQSIWNAVEKDIQSHKVLSVAGIASPGLFEEHVKQHYALADRLYFADHHHYKKSDFEKIEGRLESLGPEAILLTTEKDAVKWMHNTLAKELLADKAYYIPIEVQMLPGSEAFDSFVKESVKNILQEKAIP